MALTKPEALADPAEMVRYEDAAGRISAEMIAPAPGVRAWFRVSGSRSVTSPGSSPAAMPARS